MATDQLLLFPTQSVDFPNFLPALASNNHFIIPSEARLYPGSIEIFRHRRRRRRRRQPEVGLKTSISQA